jgi:virginiamycin B lyase
MSARFMPSAPVRAIQHHSNADERGRPRTVHRHRRRVSCQARVELHALEDRCLLSDISGYTEYPIPSGNAGWYSAVGPDGNLWFAEGNASKVGVFNPTTHAISEFATPTANSLPREITAGPDGNIWFTEFGANKLARISPQTDAITEFKIPSGSEPWGITTGPGGNIWFTEISGTSNSAIGMFNVSTHAITLFPITYAAGPHGITVGPDGNLWFADYSNYTIGEMNPTTHAFNQFALPGDQPQPYDIAAGLDGNLWFTVPSSYDGNGGTWVGTINPTTHAFTMLATPASYGITSGPDGNIWFGDRQLGSLNPASDAITQFPVPAMHGITSSPDGNLWLVSGSDIIVATLATSTLVVTQQPPASVSAGGPFGLTVQAEDSSGNLISSFNGLVTVALASSPGGAHLGGTLTVQASGGVANFSGLTLTTAASDYALYVSGGGFGWGVSNTFNVTPAAPTQLVITQEPPATVNLNGAFGLTAAIEDQYGNVVTTATNTVSVAFANNPTGATLGGTLSTAASQGVATLSGLTINKIGSGYTLQVTGSGLSSAITTAIKVTKKGAGGSAPSAPVGVVAPDALLGALVFDGPDSVDTPGIKKQIHST